VAGLRARTLRRAGDIALDVRAAIGRTGHRLDELAARGPRRDVLVLSAYRPQSRRIGRALRELRVSRHTVRVALACVGPAADALAADTVVENLTGGKFPNLNAALAAIGAQRPPRPDWTLVIDDDVVLPERFLDRFLGLCEGFDLALAQPAQSLRSHAAWRVTRRRGGSLLRETRFVEIGPVTAFRRDAAAVLLPFPDLRYGWGLDAHWAALAAEHGWRLGVADAVAVRHEDAAVGAAYPTAEAIDEARRFLAGRPYVDHVAARETIATHTRLP